MRVGLSSKNQSKQSNAVSSLNMGVIFESQSKWCIAVSSLNFGVILKIQSRQYIEYGIMCKTNFKSLSP